MRGFVIPLPKMYQEIAVSNIYNIRNKFKCDLPIEIWEAGAEIDDEYQEKISGYSGIFFRNTDEFNEDPASWRGFQIKAFATYHSQFDECILCDADVRFLRDPQYPFGLDGYKATGSYFFRDLKKWKYSKLSDTGKKFHSAQRFQKRKDWIHSIIPEKPSFFPGEWSYMYSADIPTKPVPEAYMESGVVYMDKTIHKNSLNAILDMNTNRETSYKVVHGDKETWWLGCCVAGTPFFMNPQYPTYFWKLVQRINNSPFYVQK